MARTITKIAVIVITVLCVITSVLACECDGPKPSPSEALKQADVVFSAEVASVQKEEYNRRAELVIFKVEKVWKGAVGPKLDFHTLINMCSFEFVPGKKYLVYASRRGDLFGTSFCSRTKLLVAAASDIKELGEGKTP